METNALAGSNTINLPAGTYTLTIAGAGEALAATGDLNIRQDLTINGAGATTTIIDGNNLDRVLHILLIGTVNISGITIRNGNGGGDIGGGILISAGSLTLTNSIVIGNTASSGGGIFNYGNLTLTNSTLSGNSAPLGFGGGIDNEGSVTITNSVIRSNSARNAGGGINNDGTLTLNNVIISENSSGGGGGISSNSGTHTLANVTISNNSALSCGGIINSSGTLTMTNSTISGNTATSSDGGGICNSSGTLTMTNSTISGNTANFNGKGGGISNWGRSSLLTITNSTISGNTANFNGGGVFNSNGTVTLMNAIVANSPSGGNCSGTITSNGHNLSSDNTCGFAATGDMNNTAPLLGPLADNGGSTQTHALLLGSPTIDAADPASFPSTDQRGVSRPQGIGPDIGAYEFMSSVTVPTMTEWGMIIFMVFAGLVSIYYLRRQRTS